MPYTSVLLMKINGGMTPAGDGEVVGTDGAGLGFAAVILAVRPVGRVRE